MIVKGRVDRRDEGETKLRAIEIAPFEAVPELGEVRLRVDGRVAGPAFVEELTRIIALVPGRGQRRDGGRDRRGRARPAPRARLQGAPEADFFSEVRVLGGEAQLV